MGMFFTWHSSDHSCHLDVKWKPQDEIHGADNTVERRITRGCSLPLPIAGALIETRANCFSVSGLQLGNRPTGSYPKTGVMSGWPTIRQESENMTGLDAMSALQTEVSVDDKSSDFQSKTK